MDDSRYQVSVQDYIDYHQNGYIIVRNLVSQDEVEEIRQHTEDLMLRELGSRPTFGHILVRSLAFAGIESSIQTSSEVESRTLSSLPA